MKKIIRYSEAFKLRVVRAIEQGEVDNCSQAREKYGVGGASTVEQWVRKYGMNHLIGKVIREEKSEEKNELKRLKKRASRIWRPLRKRSTRRGRAKHESELQAQGDQCESSVSTAKDEPAKLLLGTKERGRRGVDAELLASSHAINAESIRGWAAARSSISLARFMPRPEAESDGIEPSRNYDKGGCWCRKRRQKPGRPDTMRTFRASRIR